MILIVDSTPKDLKSYNGKRREEGGRELGTKLTKKKIMLGRITLRIKGLVLEKWESES